MPLSWVHYNVGLRHITRAKARYRLDIFRAVGATAWTKQEDREAFVAATRMEAGYLDKLRRK